MDIDTKAYLNDTRQILYGLEPAEDDELGQHLVRDSGLELELIIRNEQALNISSDEIRQVCDYIKERVALYLINLDARAKTIPCPPPEGTINP